jgi:hypothetical protein
VVFADLYPRGEAEPARVLGSGVPRGTAEDQNRRELDLPEGRHATRAGHRIIADEAKKIMAAFPQEKLAAEIAEMSPEAWAKESYTLGCTKAYPEGPHPGDTAVQTLWPEFATQTREIAQHRVALAGYRQAKALAELFKD